jgi:hypothetical protein
VRALRVASLLLVLPFAGCIVAIDHGGQKGLDKRTDRVERRIEVLERERGIAPPPQR